jgi:hypothetical protein
MLCGETGAGHGGWSMVWSCDGRYPGAGVCRTLLTRRSWPRCGAPRPSAPLMPCPRSSSFDPRRWQRGERARPSPTAPAQLGDPLHRSYPTHSNVHARPQAWRAACTRWPDPVRPVGAWGVPGLSYTLSLHTPSCCGRRQITSASVAASRSLKRRPQWGAYSVARGKWMPNPHPWLARYHTLRIVRIAEDSQRDVPHPDHQIWSTIWSKSVL